LGIADSLFVLTAAALFFLLLPEYPHPEIYQPGQDLIQAFAHFDPGLQVEAVNSGSIVVPGDFLPVTDL
jgi:hypothetical protein